MPDQHASFQSVIDYLDFKEFNYNSEHDEFRVTLTMSGRNANFRFNCRITHGGEYIQVTSYYPFYVREEKLRPSVAELITRANYNMPLGKFEMDMKDGEVRFHITHIIGDQTLSPALIEKLFMTAFFTIDRYFPAFMQHIHAGYTPEDAIFHVELDINAERVVEVSSKEASKPSPQGKPKRSRKKGNRNPPKGEGETLL